ncbi:MAG: hypothetical protein JWO53_1377 [Chlamydiia bacterium]|nr:hypothetical protein [Chlamydiia bacterium]
MKIRSRLLLLILPTVLGVILSISFLSYLTWYHELLSQFNASLETIVVSSSEIIDGENHEWLADHLHDPDIIKSKSYQKYVRALKRITKELPVTSIYTVKIESVRIGEPVLINHPISEQNRIYDGKDKSLAYRQIYIIDTGSLDNEPFHPPGDEDFSESGEVKVYTTKQPYVTPIYKAKSSGMRYMTAFAPIINKHGDVVALVAADLSLEVLDSKAHETQGFILLGALATVFLIMIGVVFIANNISQPVEQLKNAALTLAAGNYGKKIEVHGPQEITELANTLNTLSECLREHLSRLEESSLLREKMVGEVECLRLLQTKLIQGVAENFSHPHIQIKAIGIAGRAPDKAAVLEILKNKETAIELRFKEANFIGFDGIYELIQGQEVSAFIQLSLTQKDKSTNSWLLDYQYAHMPQPMIWSVKNSEISSAAPHTLIENNDFLILVNNSLDKLLHEESVSKQWFSRVFRHFADEGMDGCMALLSNELAFLAKRYEVRAPLQAICIQFTGTL